MDADVLIVGTGAMGSMAAWHLAAMGRQVIAFEQFFPGHDRGASGGDTRIFRTLYGEGPEYVPLLLEAQHQWRRLEELSGTDLLTLTGGLMIGPAESPFLEHVRASAAEYSLPHDELSVDEARRQYPQHNYLDHDQVIIDPNAGFLRPERAVRAAITVAAHAGARVLHPCNVNAIRPVTGGVEVMSSAGPYRAPKALVTTGPWVLRLFPEYSRYMRPRRLIQPWFLADDPAQFAPERFPIFCRKEADADIAGFPSIDAAMVKTGPNDTYDRDNLDDPDDLARTTPLDDLEAITRAVTKYLNGISGPPARVTNYADAYSRDGHAVLGWPQEGLPAYVMAGFSGHGFKFASALGAVAAEVLTSGTSRLPVGHLSLSRFADAPVTENVRGE